MKKILVLLMMMSCLVPINMVQARDFTADDFDPADPEQVDSYIEALAGLTGELTIPVVDAVGRNLFTVKPLPLEIVALAAQLKIHVQNITDPIELMLLLDKVNSHKPTINSFPVMLEGEPQWVLKNVSMYYSPDESGTELIRVPLVWMEDTLLPDDRMASTWMFIAEDEDQLTAFLIAPSVIIVVGEGDEEGESVGIECGFWRQWGLFDMREEIVEEVPEGEIVEEVVPQEEDDINPLDYE